ncbi:MAG: hypothetical protein FP815_06400, partial [Desulfobulbaceae bacterium]|nr:hypothetical protein [Desulfobulbaceae bacterium]
LTIDAEHGVLANDSDPDGDAIHVASTSFGSDGGTLTMWTDGRFSYQSAAGFTGTETFTVNIADSFGAVSSETLTFNVNQTTLQVTNLVPTASGFDLFFNGPLNGSVLNLYDTQTGGLGAADITLIGSTSGAVKGSMVVDAAAGKVRFTKTGGPLAADTYTVTARSATNGFATPSGQLLDGNSDGTAGDNYVASFTVASFSGRTLEIADFMRGPGQEVNLPTTGADIPITLSDGNGVQSLSFTVLYNPALLTIRGASAGTSLPTNSSVTATITSGRVDITVTGIGTLTAGIKQMVKLDAIVPDNAPYGAKHLIELTNVQINSGALTARGDNGLHLVGYSGETSGNAAYSTLDAQLASRVVVRLDSGFAAYPNVDPLIVADVNANAELNSLDSTTILREAAWYTTGNAAYNRLEIDPIPAGVVPIFFGGPDPKVTIPTTLTASKGSIIRVPINLEPLEPASGLQAVEIRLSYDPQVLRIKSINRGTITSSFGSFISSDSNGILRIDTSSMLPLGELVAGTLAEIEFEVIGVPANGKSVLDLQWVNLNDGHMVLTPLPVPGADEADGQITITKEEPKNSSINPFFKWTRSRQTSEDKTTDEDAKSIIRLGETTSLGATLPIEIARNKSSAWVKNFVDQKSSLHKISGSNARIMVSLPVNNQATGGVKAAK